MSEFGGDRADAGNLIGAGYAPIFARKNPGGRRFRLGIFLAAAFTLHAFLFYLFQVVYPPSRRLVRQPAGITVLSTADPAATALLNRVAERSPAFEGGIGESAALLAAKQNFVADYVATYRGYQPQLRHPSATILPKPLPLLATPGAITLPVVERPMRPPAPASNLKPVRATAILVVENRASGNTDSDFGWIPEPSAEPLPDSVAQALAELPSPPRLRVGIDTGGRVVFVGAINELPPEVEKPLRAAASRLHFKRATGITHEDTNAHSAVENPPSRLALTFVALSVRWIKGAETPD